MMRSIITSARSIFRRANFYITVSLACITAAHGQANPASETAAAEAPRYMFTLSLPEFSMFNNALTSGLRKKGGAAEIELRIVNMPQAARPYWVVSTGNANAVDIYRQWVSAELLDVVEATDFDSMDSATTQSLDSLGSLGRRLAFAIENPVRPLTRVTGKLSATAESPVLTLDDGSSISITSDSPRELSGLNGEQVRAVGVVTGPNRLQIKEIVPATTNTLELFTMPFCPYGQQALLTLANHQRKQAAAGESSPELEVRYIFYRISEDPQSEYYCLQGQREFDESVIQILIRENYPDNFIDYLLIRFRNPEAPWQQLAVQAGIEEAHIPQIARFAMTNSRAIVESEYAYVHDLCGIDNRSPSYFWKSQLIDSPSAIEAFQDLDEAEMPASACSQ